VSGAASPSVVDDLGNSRLVVRGQGSEAELVYEVDGAKLLLLHTGVPEAFRGQGVGGRLVSAAVAKARSGGLTIVPWCPYARRWLQDHPGEAEGVSVDFDAPPSAGHSA
jgi:predicted GNAT family acetyltransferase